MLVTPLHRGLLLPVVVHQLQGELDLAGRLPGWVGVLNYVSYMDLEGAIVILTKNTAVDIAKGGAGIKQDDPGALSCGI